MKKKVLVLIMTAALLAVVGCGNQANSQPETNTEAAQQKVEETKVEEETTEQEAEETADAEEEKTPAEDPDDIDVESEFLNDGTGIAPDIDISGCDTFTQIVDRKLESGMGYANAKIGDEDVLLVASGCYDWGGGQMVAIDATIYRYDKDGVIEEVAKVTCGGTAYPLTLNNDILYCGANHWMVKDTIKDGKLSMVEQVNVEYGEGEANYYYTEAGLEPIVCEDDSEFNQLYTELEDATVIEFSVVGDV